MSKDQAGTWGLWLTGLAMAWIGFCLQTDASTATLLYLWAPVTFSQIVCIAVQMGARPWSIGRKSP